MFYWEGGPPRSNIPTIVKVTCFTCSHVHSFKHSCLKTSPVQPQSQLLDTRQLHWDSVTSKEVMKETQDPMDHFSFPACFTGWLSSVYWFFSVTWLCVENTYTPVLTGICNVAVVLIVFTCTCGKEFKNIPVLNEEGKQTLIMYNQEGGVSECKVCWSN